MKHLCLFIFVMISFCLNAQETFFTSYDEPYNEIGFHVVKNGEEGYLILGASSKNTIYGLMLKKVDHQGEEIWNKYYDTNNSMIGEKVCLDKDGNIILCMDENTQTGVSIIIKKLDQSGTELFSKNITEGFHRCMSKVKDGYIICGHDHISTSGLSFSDIMVVRLDDSFNVIWKKNYYPTTLDSQINWASNSIFLDDHLYVVGNFYDNPGYGLDSKSYVLKINLQGDSIWTKTLNDYSYQLNNSIIANSNNNIVVHGFHDKNSNQLYQSSIICMDQDANILWENELMDEGKAINCSGITETGDGGYISCGAIGTLDGQSDVVLYKTDSDGENLWKKVINKSYNDSARDLLLDDNDDIICTGFTQSDYPDGFKQLFIMKTDSDGNLHGIEDIPLSSNISISPNPASGYCSFVLNDLNAGDVKIDVFDLSGRCVYHSDHYHNGTKFSTHIDLEHIKPGVYTIQVQTAEKRYSEKLIIR